MQICEIIRKKITKKIKEKKIDLGVAISKKEKKADLFQTHQWLPKRKYLKEKKKERELIILISIYNRYFSYIMFIIFIILI